VDSGRQVIVGRVLGSRGLAGEISVEVISDSPDRFSSGGVLFLEGRSYRIERSSRLSRGNMALKLEGINTRSHADNLRGQSLTVPEEMVPAPPEGVYYHYQILDLQVYTREREYLGRVTEIFSTGVNEVYVVSGDGREVLLPALEDVILDVDVGAGEMTVDLPEGLIPG